MGVKSTNSSIPSTKQNGTYSYDGTPGRGLEYKDHQTTFNGKDYRVLNWDDVEAGLASISRNRKASGGSISRWDKDEYKLLERQKELYPLHLQEEFQERMNEYLAGMGEYLGAMSEAMNREEPAAEPLKSAQQEMSAAQADTDRKQLLRRGLMSTYTRYGQSGSTQRLGA